MEQIKTILNGWHSSLCKKIERGALYSHNPTAHKWKAPYRSMVLRELTFWRVTDLLSQVVLLATENHVLGARILLRSAIETLGVLIYLNQKTDLVIQRKESFSSFCDVTSKLMLGSKNKSTSHEARNIVSILKQCDKRYPGILEVYEKLCESTHPNYDGICYGYSYVNEKEYETIFKNRWAEKYKRHLEDSILLCMETFEDEYNKVWPTYFEKLEKWIEENDAALKAEIFGI
ncbi:MAG: hypothetical protein ACLPX5_08440 [Dissulfurispiraceae bacterium]